MKETLTVFGFLLFSSFCYGQLPLIKTVSIGEKYVNWGTKPVDDEFGPPSTWTWSALECDGLHAFKASRSLAPKGEYTYLASNVNDDDPTTAWVEGDPEYGIGEFLEFDDIRGKVSSEVSILNGYQSSKASWENNSRVKKFKVSINGKDICILELADVMGVQTFRLLSNAVDEGAIEGATMKFTILEVYPGLRYKDTAISGVFYCLNL